MGMHPLYVLDTSGDTPKWVCTSVVCSLHCNTIMVDTPGKCLRHGRDTYGDMVRGRFVLKAFPRVLARSSHIQKHAYVFWHTPVDKALGKTPNLNI